MNQVCFITVCSPKYLNHYKILYKSIKKHIPEADTLLYYGGTEPGDFHWLNIAKWIETLNYNTDWERYCAVRATCVLDAMNLGYEKVILLGADTEFFDHPTELLKLLDTQNLVMSPYTREPLGNNPKEFPHDGQILEVGQMNADMIGLRNTPATIKFLEWLDKSLKTNINYHNRLVLDQYWWNYAFSLLDLTIVLRTLGYNVQYNAINDMIKFNEKWHMKDGSPLVLFHYAGFDGDPVNMSRHQNRYVATGEMINFYKSYGERIK